MHKHHIAVLGLVASCVAAGGASAQDKQTGELKFKAFSSFDFIMPQDIWTPVTGSVNVAHPGGKGFRAQQNGLKLSVDVNGDGSMDKDVKGTKGYLQFRSGNFHYAARFQGDGKAYKFASSCAQVGTVGGVPVMVFDLNNNGRYDEVGVDAMIVGGGKAASYLSKVVSHKGELYDFEVSADGSQASVTPHNGEAGTISLASGFHARARLEAVVVSDGQGSSFNVAGKSGLKVPVGEYTIVSGYVSKGSQYARIRSGKMAPLVVRAEQTVKADWGGPLMAEFTHARGEGKVTVTPNDLKFYGKAGEEYFDWYPNAKSPKFSVCDAQSGKEVGSFIFSGC